jgi:hypothetical protein
LDDCRPLRGSSRISWRAKASATRDSVILETIRHWSRRDCKQRYTAMRSLDQRCQSRWGVGHNLTCFSSPKFVRTLKWRLPFLGLNFRIVGYAYTSISRTDIHKTKRRSILLTYNIFIIFKLSAPSIQLLQGQVIHGRRSNRPNHRDTSGLVPYFSRPAMKIRIMLHGNYLQHNAVCI